MNPGPEILNPLDGAAWDEQLAPLAGSDIFHSAAWCRVLVQAYGFRPRYIATRVGGQITAVLPCMTVQSWFAGRRGVSLPFTDYCRPVARDLAATLELVQATIGEGRRAGWRTLELRTVDDPGIRATASAEFFGHTLNLCRDEQEMLRSFRENVQRNIRKAELAGVTTSIRTDRGAVESFYEMNCLTRRMHGLPPQPRRFFSLLLEHILSKGLGCIALAEWQNRVLAGACFLRWGKKAYYKYGASDPRQKEQRANNAVLWAGIRHFAEQGCASLCLGRTEPENEGLRHYKLGWRPEEQSVKYWKYNLVTAAWVQAQPRIHGWHNAVFRRMPLPVLRLTGALLYRHMG